MAIFSKIFTVKDGTEQVVVVKRDFDHDDDHYKLEFITQAEDNEVLVTITATGSYKDEEKYNEVFEQYNQEDAEKFRTNIVSQFLNVD